MLRFNAKKKAAPDIHLKKRRIADELKRDIYCSTLSGSYTFYSVIINVQTPSGLIQQGKRI